ncbi:hypothetical protein ACA910_021786 [Epithemia clementina (nom. ined.)]
MAEKPSIEAPNFGQQDADTTLGRQINEELVASTAPGGLSDLLTKILLRDFEQSGEDRQDFDLKGLCDNNTDSTANQDLNFADKSNFVERRSSFVIRPHIAAISSGLTLNKAR